VSTASADGMDDEKENNGAKLENDHSPTLPLGKSKRQRTAVIRKFNGIQSYFVSKQSPSNSLYLYSIFLLGYGFPVTPAPPKHPSSSPMTVSTDDSIPMSNSTKEDSPCDEMDDECGELNEYNLIPSSFRLRSPEQSKERMFGEEAAELEFDPSFLLDLVKTRNLELSHTTLWDGTSTTEVYNKLYDLCEQDLLLLEHKAGRNTMYNGGPSTFQHVMDTLRKYDRIDSLFNALSKEVDIKGCYTGAYGEELFGKDSAEDASEDMGEVESDVDIDEGGQDKEEHIPLEHQDNGDEDENDITEGGDRTPLHQDKERGGGFIPIHQDGRYGAKGDATHRILFNVGCRDKELWFKKGKKVCGLRITHGSVVSMSEKAGGVTGDIYHAATKAPKSWIIVVEVAKKN
jgi:hypothetical protein